MLSSIKGLMTTISEFFRPIVTAQYPEKHLPIADRYMGFPVLMYDDVVDEPYCTGCMVCVRNCPTNCMSAIMKDNPKNESGESKRRKIIDAFERAILSPTDQDLFYLRTFVNGLCAFIENNQLDIEQYRRQQSEKKLKENN